MERLSSSWGITKHSPSAFTLDLGTECRRVLQVSDLHWDNKHCDRAALKRDLDEAKAQGVPIIMVGDTFCAMQGKWDKRKDERQLRPEHRGGNYFDKLVDTASEWFAPYVDSIALITYGNHETSIIQHHNTDLLQRLHQKLRDKGSKAELGAYAGFLKVVAPGEKGSTSVTKVVCWNHGNGGGGEVTRGMIDNNRSRGMAYADIYIGGHIHRRNADENVLLELDRRSMNIVQKHQWFLRSSTYKKETGIDEQDLSGYHIERRGIGERPIGGWWWEFQPLVVSHGGRQARQRTYELRFRPTPTWA
jgi:hypothetical protein